MIREIVIDENYQTVRLFDSIEKGDIYKVPYDKKRHNGIKLEASRRNRDLRLMGKLKNKMDVKYRVSATEYPGYTSRGRPAPPDEAGGQRAYQSRETDEQAEREMVL